MGGEGASLRPEQREHQVDVHNQKDWQRTTTDARNLVSAEGPGAERGGILFPRRAPTDSRKCAGAPAGGKADIKLMSTDKTSPLSPGKAKAPAGNEDLSSWQVDVHNAGYFAC